MYNIQNPEQKQGRSANYQQNRKIEESYIGKETAASVLHRENFAVSQSYNGNQQLTEIKQTRGF